MQVVINHYNQTKYFLIFNYMFNRQSIFDNSDNKQFITKLVILALFLLFLLFVYNILEILVILFFALFLNILFAPFLNAFNKYKIRDSLWMIIIYLIIILVLFIIFFAVVPIFVKQIILLVSHIEALISSAKNIYLTEWIDGFNMPWILKSFLTDIDFSYILDSIKSNISSIGAFLWSNINKFLFSGIWIFSAITNSFIKLILLTIFTFFIALERKDIRIFFYKIIPVNYSKYLLSKEDFIVKSLHNWLKWQLILCISIFFLTLIWLLFLRLFWINIDNYFTLSLIAGLMEFIPYIGPFIALLPAIAIALWISMKAVGIIIVLYIIIQQIEGNLLVPFVMGKTLSISPFVVILAMTIGGSLFGIIWILLAVPIISVFQIFVWDYLKGRK